MAIITHKQGDTLEWVITLMDGEFPADISSWVIRAQVRSGDTLIFNLTVTVVSAIMGQFRLSATAAETDVWPAGSLSCDVEFTDTDSNVFSTETFTITVLEDVTHD
jgi:hypothetical protein